MFGGIAPGDWRPSDFFSFAEASGQFAETHAAAFQAFGPQAPPQAFGIAPGEDIGIRSFPTFSVGYGGVAGPGWPIPVYRGPDTPIPYLPPMAAGSMPGGSRPEDFEEGGVWGEGSPDWEYEGKPWDPYDTPDFPSDGGPGPVVIPTDAGEGEPDPYEPTTQEAPVAIDWGDVISGTIDIIQGQVPGGGFAPPAIPGPATLPSGTGPLPGTARDNLRWNPRTGRWECKRRRRRRRLLTPTDLSDLAALQALVGKGSSALNMAVAKAVRR